MISEGGNDHFLFSQKGNNYLESRIRSHNDFVLRIVNTPRMRASLTTTSKSGGEILKSQ